jgi:ATP-dependent Clp protease ATP-binding subunit ClpA
VFNVLLQVLDEAGVLTDGQGLHRGFQADAVVLTSNLGEPSAEPGDA